MCKEINRIVDEAFTKEFVLKINFPIASPNWVRRNILASLLLTDLRSTQNTRIPKRKKFCGCLRRITKVSNNHLIYVSAWIRFHIKNVSEEEKRMKQRPKWKPSTEHLYISKKSF